PGRQALQPAAGEPEAVPEARAAVLEGSLLGEGRGRARRRRREGPLREVVRKGRVLAQDAPDLEAGALEVRLAHHRGDRPDQAAEACEADSALAGQGGDPADAAAEPEDRRDPEVAAEADEGLLQDDRLPGRLRASARPGSLQAAVDDLVFVHDLGRAFPT